MSTAPNPLRSPFVDEHGIVTREGMQYLLSLITLNVIPYKFTQLPAANASSGQTRTVTDSTVNTWGSIVAGGGTFRVLAYSNGTNWTVAAV